MNKSIPLGIALCFILVVYSFFYSTFSLNLFTHNVYDTYTRQALQWREGKIALDGDIPYLELAIYQNKYWVSFPPFPAVIEFLLLPFFGSETPNTFVSTLYIMGSMAAITALLLRLKRPLPEALFWGLAVPIGSSIFILSLSGSVWFTAQTLAFLLSALAVLSIMSKEPKHWHAALLFWSLSIACRPLQIFFGPLLFFLIFTRVKTLPKFLPYFIVPIVIGSIIGIYNYVRFDNPAEFGHTYLPAHMRAEHGQFSTAYIMNNLVNITRLPSIENGEVVFPLWGGFAFYLSNPLYVVLILRVFSNRNTLKTKPAVVVGLLTIATHFFFNTLHLSFGAFQFGTRILADSVPYMLLTVLLINVKLKKSDVALLVFGMVLNLYGAHYFYSRW